MKKILSIVIAAVLCLGLFSGCNAKKEEADDGRTITYPEIGLSFRAPDSWKEYEDTNLYAVTTQGDGYIAKVKYSFISAEDKAALEDGSADFDLEDALKAICEFVVLEKENLETVGVQNLFSSYSSAEEIGSHENDIYYLLSGASPNLDGLSDEDRNAYQTMADSVSDMKATVSVTGVNREALEEAVYGDGNTITFMTKTLKDEDIDSTVFAPYEVTMINFGATYAADESPVLEELKKKLADYPEVNLIAAYIDTPENTANQKGLEMRNSAGATFQTLVLDASLAQWVTSNLEGVPTTIFVNKDGDIIGNQIQGAQTAEDYMSKIQDALTIVRNS